MKVLSITKFNDTPAVVVWNNSNELGIKKSFWIFDDKLKALDFLKSSKIYNKKQAIEKLYEA